MRTLILFALLAASPALAQEQQFIGSGTFNGITYNWDFTTSTSILNLTSITTGQPATVDSVLVNGTLSESDEPLVGQGQVNGTYQYASGETALLGDWGLINSAACAANPLNCTFEWELVSSGGSTELMQDPTASGSGSANTYESLGYGTVVTPEPSTYLLMLAALAVIAFWKRNELRESKV